MSDLIGQTLGSYLLESLIGSGPNGRVYRARQVRLNRTAAVKVLAPRLVHTPDFSRRFSAAMQRAAGLRGQQIADIEDFGEAGELAYIAMELYDEGSLRTFLQSRIRQRDPLEIAQVVEIVRQAAEGLHAAHVLGFVHGHVKPENILLLRRIAGAAPVRVRVSDFGLLEVAGNTPITTFTYSSPEQALNGIPVAQSDIYALGVVLYEVTTGYVPFAVKTAEEAAEKHGRALPVPPRMVSAQLPIELEQIILRCLAKRPEQRFATAAELAQALASVVQATSPGQTVLLADLPTQSMVQSATQRIAPIVVPPVMPTLDPASQPTVRSIIDPALQPTMMASTGPQVQLLDGAGNQIRAVDLTSAGVTIGRAPQNTLQLDNEQVSRHHARVDWDGRTATITDLGAANGTQLDAMRLPPSMPVPWGFGQRAQIGPFSLRLNPPAGVAVQAPPAGDPLLQGLLNNANTTAGLPVVGAAATQAFGGARLSLLVDQEQITATPGQREIVSLMVVNSGTTPDTVTLSVEGAPGMWVGVPQQAIQVPPGGRVPVSLTLGVPREPDSLAGDYPVIIRARSGMQPGESATARARWSVLPFSASSVSISPRRASGRRDASYQVTVRNDGNQTETFLLSTDDDAQQLQYAFTEENLTLDPGQTMTVGLMVAGQGRMFGGDETTPFRVAAQAGDERPANATAQFVSEPSLSPAIPLVLAILVGLALVFFFLRNVGGGGVAVGGTATPTIVATAEPTATPPPEPGAPVINQFAIDPTTVQPGQAVTVFWNVSGADSVDINVFGNVAAQGQQQRVIDQNTDIVLVARGGGKETRRVIQAFAATPVPPTAAPVPPTETPVPPTPVPPTPVPPTPVPPTVPPAPTALPEATAPPLATVAPAPAVPINLSDAASTAAWSNTVGPITYGKPDESADDGGYAEVQNFALLENNRPTFGPLYTVPLSGTGGFIEGIYQVTQIGNGQRFLADVAFPQRTSETSATVRVSYNGEVIFEQEKGADGELLPIDIDLTPFAGTGGSLTLRVENVANPRNTGLYWIRPRVDRR